jgi:hypothetical protein
MLRSTRIAATVAFALLCQTAAAAPRDELHAAFANFLAAKSFRATVTDLEKGEQAATMEFHAPDRYRIPSLKGPSQLIVGDSLYVEMQGKLTRLPIPGVGERVAQYRNEDFLRETESDRKVEAPRDERVDGQAAKVHRYTITRPFKADAKTSISMKSGLPLRTGSNGSVMGIESTTRMSHSGDDDPTIAIAEAD